MAKRIGAPPATPPISEDSDDRHHRRWRSSGQLIAAGSLGAIFLLLMLIVATSIPNPTEFQITVFRVILSVTAAAFGAIVPGFLELEMKFRQAFLLRTGGALAMFVIIYWWNPPKLAQQHAAPVPLPTAIELKR